MAAMQKQTLTQTLLSLLKTQIHFADFRIKKLFVFSGIYNFETSDKIIILNILQIMIRLNNLSLVLKLLHNNKVRYLITIDNVFLLQNIKHYFYSLFQKNKYITIFPEKIVPGLFSNWKKSIYFFLRKLNTRLKKKLNFFFFRKTTVMKRKVERRTFFKKAKILFIKIFYYYFKAAKTEKETKKKKYLFLTSKFWQILFFFFQYKTYKKAPNVAFNFGQSFDLYKELKKKNIITFQIHNMNEKVFVSSYVIPSNTSSILTINFYLLFFFKYFFFSKKKHIYSLFNQLIANRKNIMKYFKQKSRKNKKKFFFVLNKNTPYDTPPKKLKKKKNLKVNTNYNVTYSNLQNTNKKTNKNTENKTKYNKNVINHYNKKNIANNTIKI